MLHKDYDRKSLIEKKYSGREPQGVRRQNELIGGKPPVVREHLSLTLAEMNVLATSSTV
jgi:hypothetical protein